MHRLALLAAAALATALPAAARAQAPSTSYSSGTSSPPVGLTLAGSLAAGGELGLSHGKAGMWEGEVVGGWRPGQLPLAFELGAAFGEEPDGTFGLRPGIRWYFAGSPLRLRVALDASDARDHDFGWRWLLVGAALETRLTSELGLFAEMDSGVPLRQGAGVPLLFRGGVSFRF